MSNVTLNAIRTSDPAEVALMMETVRPWLCSGVRTDIRYFAKDADGKTGIIVHALVHIGWQTPAEDSHFECRIGLYRIGQHQQAHVPRQDVEQLLRDFANGEFTVFGERLRLPGSERLGMVVDVSDRVRFENIIRMQFATNVLPQFDKTTTGQIDDGLRIAAVPFDGTQDVFTWLGLPDPESQNPPSSITVIFSPPADFDIDTAALSNKKLRLHLKANASVEVDKVAIALRTVPAEGIFGRRLVTDKVAWHEPVDGARAGTLDLDTGDAEQALVMLSVGGRTCRRHWFTDPARAKNTRLLAASLFDPDLKQLRAFLTPTGKLNGQTAPNFEKGVAMLLHILGFTAALNCEEQAPDLTFTTPGGAIAIVECTVQSHDVQAKAAKLQSRRIDLEEAMRINNHTPTVLSLLVCAMNRRRLDLTTAGLDSKRVILITRELIDNVMYYLRTPPHPDALWQRLAAQLPPAESTTP